MQLDSPNPSYMNIDLQIEVVESQTLSVNERKNIISFCSEAFEEDLEALFNTFSQPTHIIGTKEGKLVSHALWVTRLLQVDNDQLLCTAYIEAVATEKAYRGLGYASTIMKRIVEEIQAYELGALSPFSVAYYETLGWEPWRGPLYIRTEAGLVRTPGEEAVMIFRLPKRRLRHRDSNYAVHGLEYEIRDFRHLPNRYPSRPIFNDCALGQHLLQWFFHRPAQVD